MTVGKTVGKTVVDVLERIRNNPKITIETLADELLLSVRGVEYHIKEIRNRKDTGNQR
jgi:predicted transcriptional regulator